MSRKKGAHTSGQPVGNRSASGRLRDRTPRRIDANDGMVRKRAFYGMAANDTDLVDAIGRAYHAGLLHRDDERAKTLLLAGRRIAWQYWRIYGFGTPDSLARFQPREGGGPADPAREKIIEDALNDGLGLIRARGRDVRRAFDTLVIDLNPDKGPPWLDQIIWCNRHGKRATERDYDQLRLAVEGLEAIA